jgi:hypothetical protein
MQKIVNNIGLNHWLLTAVFFLSVLSTNAQADMVMTQTTLNQSSQAQQPFMDRHSLLGQLQSEGMQQQLLAMGISPEVAEARLASLTDAELAMYSDQLHNGPAASGAGEVVIGIFLLFVITDMLCATDIFNFVNCINK